MMSTRLLFAFLAASGAVAVVGCAEREGASATSRQPVTSAVAVILPTEGNSTSGVVRFTQLEGQVRIVADVEGLSPGRHGFHIHEYGDFTSPDAKSAGGHYNTEGFPHSAPPDPKRHAGDLGNIEAGVDGRAHFEVVVDNITINGAGNPVLGRGLVVHAGEDDLRSQPTGNAGARVGFGVIGVARPSGKR